VPPNPDSLIHIRAAQSNRTYIGADFCADETNLRDICENIAPFDVMDVNAARRDVQAGEGVEATIDAYNFGERVRGRMAFDGIIRNCLERIEAGICDAYPLDT
jgi:hypothetical protein